ncbi:DUF1579 domain-containing protein [Pseudarthrobacter sp. NamE2]|uniref:DUF1579 family protein n=1 Tax=Pseudarthrobacter sp. NamE2 TaxID=2576838 RepID=UPI0010FD2EA2|nr:DUF1579 family protein [Pseudarthrobacter sp. NamE2]TLM84942.1 DUF1579 domain-containing protein [Pseudarthrobacter sp. NamE2]
MGAFPAGDPSGDRARAEHPALAGLLGRWLGSTRLASGPWGPERTVEAEVTYRRAAGGFAVVQSYRHLEPDGSHFEGHGVFTIDPDHKDVLWYYVDSSGPAPDAPARCTWRDGILRVERRGSAGWTRHSVRVDGEVLTHVTELRRQGQPGVPEQATEGSVVGDVHGAGANGTGSAFIPFMTSTFRRS